MAVISATKSAYLKGVYWYYFYPAEDNAQVNGVWKNQLDATSPLWSSLDESAPSDDDWVACQNAVAGNFFQINLPEPVDADLTDDPVTLYWRGKCSIPGSTVRVKLDIICGFDYICSPEQVLTDSWQTYAYTLSAEEVASVGSWGALTVRVTIMGVD